MPIKSPFFPRTAELCTSMHYKEWAGYYAVSSYLVHHDAEYWAFRNAAGLLDITPLYKYRVSGPEAAEFLSRIMVRDITRLKIDRVTYCCWCNHEGKVVDDGTVMRRSENEFFVTSADPCFSWFSRFTRGYDVKLQDISDKVAGLALQGPASRDILKQISDADLDNLRYFRQTKARTEDFQIYISRTGYTGDLGYELWVENEHALKLYDALMREGKSYNLRPAGLDALDVTRIEAGLILKDVDYYNALYTLIDDRKSSPYEITLGWAVNLERKPFNGQSALIKEKENPNRWVIAGLDISWPEIESLYDKYGLPPEISYTASRESIPIYTSKDKGKQIGYATSSTWSPILKKYIALATIPEKYNKPGSKIQIEMTVEHKRHTVTAEILQPQFYNPERKRSLPTKKQVLL